MSEGLRFLVSLSLFVMLFGSVIYYFNTRIATLEKAIVKQNQVLSDFIVNVKSNVLSQPSFFAELNNTGASEEAIANAKAIYSSSNPSKKIVVPEDDNVVVSVNNDASCDEDSSDEDSGDEDSGDEESGDEDSGDEDVEVEHVDAEQVVDVEHVEVEHVDAEQVVDVEVEHVEVEHVEVEHVEVEHVEVVDVEVEHVDAEPSTVKTSNELAKEVNPVMKTIKLEEVGQVTESAALNNEELQKLKVSQLKELAKQKGIKNLTNLKKPELIKALLA